MRLPDSLVILSVTISVTRSPLYRTSRVRRLTDKDHLGAIDKQRHKFFALPDSQGGYQLLASPCECDCRPSL